MPPHHARRLERLPKPSREPIPVLRPQLPAAVRLLPYLRRIDATRCYTNWGPLASELERRLSDRFGLSQGTVVSASSGTAALVGAILAAAGRASSERPLAIVPAFTFVATASAVEQCGYRVHLADVSADDWLLEPGRLLSHPLLGRAGVVVPASAFGRPVPQEAWRVFRDRTGIPVVIDGAACFEAAGLRPATLLGTIPVTLSFHATKAFATGEGGCVITTDTALAEDVTRALNFGFYADRECRAPSTNGKMSEYHAAVGLAELDGWAAKHRAFADLAVRYRDEMERVGLGRRLVVAPVVAGCYVLFECTDPIEASRVQASLEACSAEFRFWYGGGLHAQPRWKDVSRDPLEVTERIAPLLIGLPVATDLPARDISRIARAIGGAVGDSR